MARPMAASWRTLRVFISSTFRDMQAERDHLVRFVFPRLRDLLLPRRIHLVDVDLRWGVTSERDASEVCREIIDECRPRFLCVLGGRYGWVPPGKTRSITADEVRFGVLDRAPAERGFARFYFRDEAATAAMAEAAPGEFREPRGSAGEGGLAELKRAIVSRGLAPFIYPARWDGETNRLIGLKEFGDRVCEDLLAGMIADPELRDRFAADAAASLDEPAEEDAAMEAFAAERGERFVLGSREAALGELLAHAAASDGEGYACLTGAAGSGKSAMLAQLSRHASFGAGPGTLLISHFVGASPRSTDPHHALRRLFLKLQAARPGGRADIPDDPEDLRAAFAELLRSACALHRVVILLDAVDQFGPAGPAPGLGWLPEEPPANARFILSASDGPALEELRRRPHKPREIELKPLTAADGEAISEQFCRRYGKRLEPAQRAALLAKEDAGKPLFLLAALEELRTMGAYEEITSRVAGLPSTTDGLFAWLLERLEGDGGFRDAAGRRVGRELVSRCAALLGASRHGLSQRELSDLLDRGDPQGNVAALLHLLRPYLMRRGGLLDFYHGQFCQAVGARYLDSAEKRREAHSDLASYFGAQASWLEPRRPNDRRLDELPRQLLEAGRLDELAKVLSDLDFVEAKCAAGKAHDLAADYAAALRTEGLGQEQRGAIAGFADFVREQAHVLSAFPALTFQQAANEPARTPPCAAARRRLESGEEARPWLELTSEKSADSACLMTLCGHDSAVTSCALSPDGLRAVSGDGGGSLRWWDLSTGAALAARKAHAGAVTACAFSPDGRTVMSASWDKTVKLWDARDAVPLKTLAGHGEPVKDCAFSSDGGRLVSCSETCVKVWDAAAGVALGNLVKNGAALPHSQMAVPEAAGAVAHESSLEAVALSPDGRLAATGSCWVGTVKLWHTATGTELRTLGGESDNREYHGRSVGACAFSPSGSLLAAAAGDEVKLWACDTGREAARLSGHHGPVEACAFCPDGGRIATASGDGALKLWETATGSLLGTMSGHLGNVVDCAFSSDGARLLSASHDKTLKLWDLPRVLGAERENERERLFIKARSWDGRILARRESRSCVLLADEMAVQGRALKGQPIEVLSAAFSPDGKRLVTTDERSLRLWDAATGEAIAGAPGDFPQYGCCEFSPDGTRVLAARKKPGSEEEIDLLLWSVPGLDESARLDIRQQSSVFGFQTAVFSLDGSAVMANQSEETVKVWDALTGRETVSVRVPGAKICRCALSPDGSKLLTALILDHERSPLTRSRRRMRLWDAATGEESAEWQAPDDNDGRFRFSPDGTKVVAWETSSKTRLELREVGTGRQVSAADLRDNTVRDVVFAPDGRRIACIHDAGASLWDGQESGRVVTMRGVPCGLSPDGRHLLAVENGALILWDVETGAERIRYVSRRGVRWASWSRDGRTILAHLPTLAGWFLPRETLADRIHLLRLGNIEVGPVVATPWTAPGGGADRAPETGFCCPLCRSWSPVDKSALGTRVACPACGEAVGLNGSALRAEWRRLANA